MTLNPVSATRRGMPKERLPDVMTVRFADGTFDRIDAVAGENRRAAFVRAAVERELAAPVAPEAPALDAVEAFRAIRTLAQVAIDADGGASAATTLRSILTACEKAMPDRPRRTPRKPKPPNPRHTVIRGETQGGGES